jgi:dienelactone hydrolase
MKNREQHVAIAVDARHIEGTLIMPGPRIPGILFVHGWGGSQQQYLARAREISALGCVCLAFDLTGHAGTQAERASVSRELNLRDTLAAYDLLCAHPQVESSAIAVVGSSYGGYLGAILTSMRPVKWLALRAPALYLDKGWDAPKLQLHKDQDLKTYRRSFVPATENRALHACSTFRGDVLLVESEHDDVIPHAVLTSYREACVHVRSLTYRCMDGSDHGLTDPASQQAYTALLTEWLGEMLPAARRPEGAKPPQEPAIHEPETPPQVLPH